MRIACNKNIWAKIQKVLFFLACLFVASHSYPSSSNSDEIQTSEPTKSTTLRERVAKQKANPQIIEIFNSTLFDTEPKEEKDTSFMWLHDPDLKEKRSKIIGSKISSFEAWWKIDLEAFLLDAQFNFTQVVRTKVNSRIITQITDSFFIQAEFELLTGSGSIQKVFQRAGETSGISQREILLLWKATDWLIIQGGAVNQGFLESPLLLGDIAFPSIVQNIEIFNGEEHNLSLSLQQAIPTSFAGDNSIYTQDLTKTPLLLTKSFFWKYHPESFYKVKFNSSFFHYNPLPSDIARESNFYGNTISGEPSSFRYRYTGFYFILEPSFQISSKLGLKLKLHYINNISKIEKENLNQSLLYGLQIPFDLTENIRLTSSFEYFKAQPDASVGYYNSAKYGHSNREGFIGEIVFHFYNRNIEVGFRHMRSDDLRESDNDEDDDIGNQIYYLLFLRTNYAKLY